MTDLLTRRLYNQHIAGSPLKQPEDVVRWLGAVQSQDYLGAKWSLGQRLRNGTDATIDQAFNDGRILRIHMLRPTWHFVSPEDIRWMLQLTAPHVHALNKYPYRVSGLDAPVLTRTSRLIERALEGGHSKTRKELAAILDKDKVGGTGLRMVCIMMNAELEGVVCSGPLKGKQHTYALLEERVPPARARTRDDALAELARRFFTGHGPATVRHFAWWSGLSMKTARAGLEMVQHQLSSEAINSHIFWSGPDSRRVRPGRAAYLIPEYDECLTGYRDLAVPDAARARGLRPAGDGSVRPIIFGGKRVGTWRRVILKGSLTVEANLFAKLSAAESRALEATVRRYREFLNLPATLA
ncbi:MAG: winged helix DNA-binding domain-containing protein [Gemmatimonadota bacterium]